MSFDWSEYLKVAKELAGYLTPPANQEAKLRAAISRAYYAAFIKARNHLRDKEGHSIPTTGDAHGYVSQQFELSVDSVRRILGENLVRLRIYRRQADYVDVFPELSGIARIAIRLCEEVISVLNSLQIFILSKFKYPLLIVRNHP